MMNLAAAILALALVQPMWTRHTPDLRGKGTWWLEFVRHEFSPYVMITGVTEMCVFYSGDWPAPPGFVTIRAREVTAEGGTEWRSLGRRRWPEGERVGPRLDRIACWPIGVARAVSVEVRAE